MTKPCVLLAEGTHDKEFFAGLLKQIGMDERVQAVEFGGKRNLRGFLKWASEQPNFVGKQVKAVCVTRDADGTEMGADGNIRDVPGSPDKAFKSVCEALKAAGLPFPRAPGVAQQAESGSPKVGVYILPNNSESGCLETLCLHSISKHPAKECVDRYFECAKEVGKLNPGNETKGRVQAWLALQQDPDLHVGRAAQKGYWDFKNEAFQPLVAFLQKIFE